MTFGDAEYDEAVAAGNRGETLTTAQREGLKAASNIGSKSSERNAKATAALEKAK